MFRDNKLALMKDPKLSGLSIDILAIICHLVVS